MVKKKAIEAAKPKRSDSPKSKIVSGRVRNSSTASTRSVREDDLVNYPLIPDPSNDYVGRSHDPRTGYQGSPLRPGGSRSNSSSNIRNLAGGPPVYVPYMQGQRYVSMPEGPYHRRVESAQARLRADSNRSDRSDQSRARSRSNSNMRPYPIDQLSNPAFATRPPRFDPTDSRFGSPSRRSPYGQPPLSRRTSDDFYGHDEPEVSHYMVSGSERSNSDSDGSLHEGGVSLDVKDRPTTTTGYTIKTRSAAAAASPATKASTTSKSTANKAAMRRR